MKRIQKLFLVILFSAPAFLFAQKEFTVTEATSTISIGDRTGYSVMIEGMSEKEIVKALRNWIDEKQKKPQFEETGKHELMINNLVLTQMSANPIIAYFLFEESKTGVKVTGFFNADGVFLSAATNPGKYQEAAAFMRKFGLQTEKLKIAESLDVAQKDLEKKQSDQKELEKKKEQLNSSIEDCNSSIEKAKSDLEQNAKDQEAKKNEITTQENTIDMIGSELKKYSDD